MLTHTPPKDLEGQVQMQSSQASWSSAQDSTRRKCLSAPPAPAPSPPPFPSHPTFPFNHGSFRSTPPSARTSSVHVPCTQLRVK